MTPMTVGDLKAALAEYRDDMLVGFFDGSTGDFRTLAGVDLDDANDEAVVALEPIWRDEATA